MPPFLSLFAPRFDGWSVFSIETLVGRLANPVSNVTYRLALHANKTMPVLPMTGIALRVRAAVNHHQFLDRRIFQATNDV
jgi:hypothetical protein